MFWLGKLLGGLFGYMIAGPFGAIMGLILGHFFDLSRKGHWFLFPSPEPQHTTRQDLFFKATFTLMGYIAKADGRVSENEIRAASLIMQNMMLTPALKQQAINYFRQGKSASFNIDEVLNDLSSACFQQRNLLQLFIEIQVQAAYADGALTPAKQRILEYICYRLNFYPGDFFQRSYNYNQHYQHQQKQQYNKPKDATLVDKAYRILGVPPTVNNAELKKAYRKLMSQNHPDKLVSKGLPEEMIKLATQKTQEIKSAYETVCRARGI